MSVIRHAATPRKAEPSNATACHPSRHPWTTRPPHPKKRKSAFAHQIWSVEHKPRFAVSSVYGHAG